MFQSIYQKIKDGLKKTREGFTNKIDIVLSNFRTVDENFLEELESILIQGDMGVKMADEFITQLRKRVKIENIQDGNQIIQMLKSDISNRLKIDDLSEENYLLSIKQHRPYVILMLGVNGTGKTTTIGKLAHYFKENGLKVMIGAADTFRAAAVEQLQIWAQRTNSAFVYHPQDNADPAAVAFDTYKSALAKNMDVVLIDTAGRLHTKHNLMEELKKIDRVLKKADSKIPNDYWIVIDGNSGQNAISQTQTFIKSVPLTGVVVTKLDGTAHGGVVVAIHDQFKLPIRWIGIGEKLDDLQLFNSSYFVNALFDNK